ncbi:MAG TPA: AGE family epimerase/isomerase [Caulobacteraceae bacterium]|jgi:mannose-6-phosphate isomerase|nr:AGE family epimerase/isomerase [Caulobacteraceae bacterium]
MADGEARHALTPLIARARAWTFEEALPLWATIGRDGPGLGFVERLDRDGRPEPLDFKRFRVQARQIYVFSQAHVMGWVGGLEAARAGYDFIRAHARLEGGGWAKLLTREGAITDPTFDLYDQAFALYALAWFARASGEDEPLALAEETMAAIDRRLARGDGRGYRSTDPDSPPGGLQNPHMHLLEAMLALHQTTGEAKWAQRAVDLGELFTAALFDADTSTLAEGFDANWKRVTPIVVEPGHQFEWTWLLMRLGDVTGYYHNMLMKALYEFGEKNGLDAGGRAYDEIAVDGAVVKPTHRLWPQTELLKASLARIEGRGCATHPATLIRTLGNILDLYLKPAPPGCWRDQLDADGKPLDQPIPASTLYHLFLAFAELFRLQPLIEASS